MRRLMVFFILLIGGSCEVDSTEWILVRGSAPKTSALEPFGCDIEAQENRGKPETLSRYNPL